MLNVDWNVGHIAWQEREVAIPFRLERGTFDLDAQLSRVAFDNAYRDPGFTEFLKAPPSE